MFAEFNWVDAMRQSPILLVLVACSVLTLGVAAERYLYYRRRSGDPDALLARVRSALQSDQPDQARWSCDAESHPLGWVGRRLLAALDKPGSDTEEAIHVALSEQKLVLEKNLGVLGSMAAIAPLVGLLGTVWGIMRAFHDMAATGSAAPSVVAAGVAEALLTTAAGLVIAVPAVLLYNHFTRRMSVMLTQAENHARVIRQTWREGAVADPLKVEAEADRELGKVETALELGTR